MTVSVALSVKGSPVSSPMDSDSVLALPESSGFKTRDTQDFEEDFVEKDPSGRYLRYNEMLGKGAFKTVYDPDT
ncbi:hypothetical protein PIB30_076065 [Stylosanthes scabra]|uniref:Uncharacterized protein n=1 Tax=Stylosanthes scabra TaxID=79078 RepID=A0ABU6UNZ9_9FABA|nr:hypothetical protein [Stylosanthes scabra]